MIQRTWFPRINTRAPLASGLVFAGLGGGASTVQFCDSSGRGNSGTLVNGPTWGFDATLGRWYVACDGSDDTITIPSSPAWSLSTTLTTIACWCKLTGTPSAYDNLWYSTGGTSYFRPSAGGNSSAYMAHGDNNLVLTGPAYTTAGSQFHVCVTADAVASRGDLWINGVSVNTDTGVAGSTSWQSNAMNLCSDGAGGYTLPAQLSDFMMWRRVLSSAEIQQLADPSNTLLSGLILPPRRRFWPVSGTAPTNYYIPNKMRYYRQRSMA